MTTGTTYSVALDGIAGRVVTIEADVSDGLPGWSLSGMPDPSVTTARDRCRAAIVNSRQRWPDRRVTVAMYPADVPKVGSHYDLAIALALLVAVGSVPPDSLRSSAVFGELALDGRLRSVPGVLPAALAASSAGLPRVIVPEPNVAEARLVPGVQVTGVRSLAECVALLTGADPAEEDVLPPVPEFDASEPAWREVEEADLADVRGQTQARWCVEVAAAGGHHLFLEGPPGAGKTMLAERFAPLLPDLSLEASIEVSKIHSIAGLLSRDDPLVTRPPFLAPNHNDTVPSVIGGGSRMIRPGAISLAHLGVLFLDEAPEFRPSVHDSLRQPLESGRISIRRADGAASFPARFQLILAANPCPCGRGEVSKIACQCEAMKSRRYQQRISGPVRDRIDIFHKVLPVSRAEMLQEIGPAGCTAAVRARVREARERQRQRYRGTPWLVNADVPGAEFRRRCPLPPDVARQIEEAVAHGLLTQRGADRVARMTWTLCDLAGGDVPGVPHVKEALHLRTDGIAGESFRSAHVA
ncbi:MAG: YifB family Mg chelatase-like AAA ATPase [Nocardioidaceae bacterium]